MSMEKKVCLLLFDKETCDISLQIVPICTGHDNCDWEIAGNENEKCQILTTTLYQLLYLDCNWSLFTFYHFVF